MQRIRYFYEKIKRASYEGTLWFKARRFLIISIMRPIEVVIGYMRLSRADRQLNIHDGYVDHRVLQHHHRSNPEHLFRIINAYKAAKQAQPQAALPFQIKGVWNEWIAINYKKLVRALETENISKLSNLYENLFREQFTTGTGGFDDYLRYREFFGSFYVKYVWCVYRDALLDLDFDLQRINFPLIGNPTGIFLNGKVIPFEALRHAYHAVEMHHLLQNIPAAIVTEIGGGLGGQAFQTLSMGTQVSKYLIFDIPEVASISSYFLLSAFPEKRVRLYGEGRVSTASSEEYDIAIFPHFAITQLSDLSVDLFYNSNSFSEMDGASSQEYLSIIERACRKYFMHDNHDTIFVYKNLDGSISTNIIGSKLIPSPALFKRVFKKPRVHGLPEDRLLVQYEYLYEKL